MKSEKKNDRKKDEKYSTPNHPKANKLLGWWNGIRDRIAFFALITNVVLAVGTVLLVCATRELVTGADSQSRRQLRAYIGVIPGSIENFGDRQKQTFKLTRKNYGATPAYDLWMEPHQTIIHEGDNISPTSTTPPNISGTFTLFPSAELPYYTRGIVGTDKQISLVREGGEFQIVYYGIIHYKDAFGQPHYTRYCWFFKGQSMTDKDAEGCLGHNDSN